MTPAEAASILSINPHTVRRWCAAHAPHLSPDANPGKDALRRLTGRDLEVLREVQRLRAQGVQTEAINKRLAALAFAEVDTPAQTAQENDAQRLATPAQTAQDALLLPMLTDAMDKRLDALQRHVDRLERNQRDRVIVFGIGVGVGLVAAILLLLAAYLLATIGG